MHVTCRKSRLVLLHYVLSAQGSFHRINRNGLHKYDAGILGDSVSVLGSLLIFFYVFQQQQQHRNVVLIKFQRACERTFYAPGIIFLVDGGAQLFLISLQNVSFVLFELYLITVSSVSAVGLGTSLGGRNTEPIFNQFFFLNLNVALWDTVRVTQSKIVAH